jgi:hypothetical protein
MPRADWDVRCRLHCAQGPSRPAAARAMPLPPAKASRRTPARAIASPTAACTRLRALCRRPPELTRTANRRSLRANQMTANSSRRGQCPSTSRGPTRSAAHDVPVGAATRGRRRRTATSTTPTDFSFHLRADLFHCAACRAWLRSKSPTSESLTGGWSRSWRRCNTRSAASGRRFTCEDCSLLEIARASSHWLDAWLLTTSPNCTTSWRRRLGSAARLRTRLPPRPTPWSAAKTLT